MSVDAMVAAWSWTGFTGSPALPVYALSSFTIGAGSYTTSGALEVNVTMTSPGDGSDAVKITLAANSHGGNVSSYYSVPVAGPLWGSFPDIDLYLSCVRALRGPLGTSKLYLTINSSSFNTIISVDVPGLWPGHHEVTWYHVPSMSAGAPSYPATHNVVIGGLTAPWPIESHVTGTLITAGSAGVILPGGAYYHVKPTVGGLTENSFGILPPCERGLLVTRDGAQLIARRTTARPGYQPGYVDLWRRLGPGDDWSKVATTYAPGGAAVVNHPLRAEVGLLAAGALGAWPYTYDFGDTLQAEYASTFATPLAQGTDALRAKADLLLGLARLDWSGGDESVTMQSSAGGTATVATECRTVDDIECLPHPFLDRRADGRWLCGWFLPNGYVEYLSDDLSGGAWSDNNGSVDFDADTGQAYFTAFWRGRDGRQAVAGYHFDNQQFVVLTRAGSGDPWTGPYLNVSSSSAAAPYLYERADGQWEAGWLIGGTWTRYTALRPGGTWSAV